MDGKGIPLVFLAQVDCTQLSGLPDFPHTGLLQFFTGRDDVFGMDFDQMTNQDGFRVIYYETVDAALALEDVTAKQPDPAEVDETPIARPCRIRFGTPQTVQIAKEDFRFQENVVAQWNKRCPNAQADDIWALYRLLPEPVQDILFEPDEDEAEEEDIGDAHRLGGYPHFTQDDPRSSSRNGDLDTLLFQLDSEFCGKETLILWGDCGVANFFINREALKKRDFSHVGYSWDCC